MNVSLHGAAPPSESAGFLQEPRTDKQHFSCNLLGQLQQFCSLQVLQSLTAEPPVTQEVLKTDVQIKFMIQENMTSENLLFLFEHQIKCVCIRVCVCVCSSVFIYLIF